MPISKWILLIFFIFSACSTPKSFEEAMMSVHPFLLDLLNSDYDNKAITQTLLQKYTQVFLQENLFESHIERNAETGEVIQFNFLNFKSVPQNLQEEYIFNNVNHADEERKRQLCNPETVEAFLENEFYSFQHTLGKKSCLSLNLETNNSEKERLKETIKNISDEVLFARKLLYTSKAVDSQAWEIYRLCHYHTDIQEMVKIIGKIVRPLLYCLAANHWDEKTFVNKFSNQFPNTFAIYFDEEIDAISQFIEFAQEKKNNLSFKSAEMNTFFETLKLINSNHLCAIAKKKYDQIRNPNHYPDVIFGIDLASINFNEIFFENPIKIEFEESISGYLNEKEADWLNFIENYKELMLFIENAGKYAGNFYETMMFKVNQETATQEIPVVPIFIKLNEFFNIEADSFAGHSFVQIIARDFFYYFGESKKESSTVSVNFSNSLKEIYSLFVAKYGKINFFDINDEKTNQVLFVDLFEQNAFKFPVVHPAFAEADIYKEAAFIRKEDLIQGMKYPLQNILFRSISEQVTLKNKEDFINYLKPLYNQNLNVLKMIESLMEMKPSLPLMTETFLHANNFLSPEAIEYYTKFIDIFNKALSAFILKNTSWKFFAEFFDKHLDSVCFLEETKSDFYVIWKLDNIVNSKRYIEKIQFTNFFKKDKMKGLLLERLDTSNPFSFAANVAAAVGIEDLNVFQKYPQNDRAFKKLSRGSYNSGSFLNGNAEKEIRESIFGSMMKIFKFVI